MTRFTVPSQSAPAATDTAATQSREHVRANKTRIIDGRPFGCLADWSSRLLMIWGAVAASSIIVGMLLLGQIRGIDDSAWLFLVAYFLLTLTHTGVRVARKTYVVDMATGDQRTEYVAVANTTMGVLLLVAGAVSTARDRCRARVSRSTGHARRAGRAVAARSRQGTRQDLTRTPKTPVREPHFARIMCIIRDQIPSPTRCVGSCAIVPSGMP